MWPLSPLFCQFPIRQSWSRTSVLNRSLTLQLTRPNTLPTAWYLGNRICDPTSNACTPYPTPTATFVYAQSATYSYQVTLNNQATSTYTSEFTGFSTQTFYQTIPPYAAAGLSELEFGLAALLVVAVVAAAMLFRFVRGTTGGSNVAKAELPSGTVRYCQHCGAENRRTDKFCDKCGAKLG